MQRKPSSTTSAPGIATALPSSILPKLHLFEFNDSAWFPETFRNAITEVLRALCLRLRVHEVIRPVIERVLDDSAAERIVDLCSGATGPIIPLQQQLADSGCRIPVLLTDRFPNRAAYQWAEQATGGAVLGCMNPVDATQVPAGMTGLRTLFNAFHHFKPVAARAILADAYCSRQPIAIFEITERGPVRTFSNFILSFLTMLILLPRMRARRPEWWLFTYLLPVLPLAFGWDGFVSCLRSYTASEFAQLKEGLEDQSYSWSSGRMPVPGSPIHINYFLGMPHRS